MDCYRGSIPGLHRFPGSADPIFRKRSVLTPLRTILILPQSFPFVNMNLRIILIFFLASSQEVRADGETAQFLRHQAADHLSAMGVEMGFIVVAFGKIGMLAGR